MVTAILLHLANKLARLGKEASEIWREARQLRRAMPGPADE
jgi:hypothetical protein